MQTDEPQCLETYFRYVRPVNIQVSLCIRAVFMFSFLVGLMFYGAVNT